MYGTTTGVTNIILNTAGMIASGELTNDIITDAILDADAIIEMRLASMVGNDNIPLTAPVHRSVSTISNFMAACAILERMFIGKSPDETALVTRVCKQGEKMLDELCANPEILAIVNTGMADAQPDSTTLDEDAKFTVERTTGDGESVIATGTMDEW